MCKSCSKSINGQLLVKSHDVFPLQIKCRLFLSQIPCLTQNSQPVLLHNKRPRLQHFVLINHPAYRPVGLPQPVRLPLAGRERHRRSLPRVDADDGPGRWVDHSEKRGGHSRPVRQAAFLPVPAVELRVRSKAVERALLVAARRRRERERVVALAVSVGLREVAARPVVERGGAQTGVGRRRVDAQLVEMRGKASIHVRTTGDLERRSCQGSS